MTCFPDFAILKLMTRFQASVSEWLKRKMEKENGNYTKKNMDTNKNNNQFHFSLKEREQRTERHDKENRQLRFSFFVNKLIFSSNN